MVLERGAMLGLNLLRIFDGLVANLVEGVRLILCHNNCFWSSPFELIYSLS